MTPLHQLTRRNQISPGGVTLPSGILRRKWRAMHGTALARWARTTQKHQTGVKRRPPGVGGGAQTQNRCFSFFHLYKSVQKRGAVIWSVFCRSIQPWEVSKPSDLIRARRVPGAEWRIDLPITWQRASIKQRLFTWHQRNEAEGDQ